jgi:hypothetical protein
MNPLTRRGQWSTDPRVAIYSRRISDNLVPGRGNNTRISLKIRGFCIRRRGPLIGHVPATSGGSTALLHPLFSFLSNHLSPNIKITGMEHLPMPKGAELSENDIVPYVSSTDYLGVPFLSYPQKKGFHHVMPQPDCLSFALYESGHPTPDEKLASFLQTWLFFGMLQEVFGSLYQHGDFVRSCESNEGPIQVLTTAKLPLLLNERFPATPAIDDDHTSLIAHLHECMEVAEGASGVVASRLSRKVSFSILTTIETLCSTFNAYLVKDFKFSLAWITSLPRNYWTEQMCLNGWCAREAAIASESFNSAQALHYLSKIKKSYKDDSHRNCTQEECKGMQIDLTKYEPRHCDRRCDCAIISIDNERLNFILVRILGFLSSYCRQLQDSRVDVLLNPSLPALTTLETFSGRLVSLRRSNADSEILNRRVESSH